MSQLVDGIYKASLISLRQAVFESATKLFADKHCQQRMINRVMREINLKLTLVPPKPQEAEEEMETIIFDETYKHTIDSFLHNLEAVLGHQMLKLEAKLFAEAWVKARTSLDCRDLQWAGWDNVLNRLIDFMDQCGDGNPTFILMRSLDQWREQMSKSGIPELAPSVAPYLHLHVEMLDGYADVVQNTLHAVGYKSSLVLLSKLGLNDVRSRYLLTMLSPAESRRIQHLLKIDGVKKVTGSKLDYTL